MNSESGKHVWRFSTAGRVFFGWGAVAELRNVPREFGQRVLACTDQNIVKAGICDTVLVLLDEEKDEMKIMRGGGARSRSRDNRTSRRSGPGIYARCGNRFGGWQQPGPVQSRGTPTETSWSVIGLLR